MNKTSTISNWIASPDCQLVKSSANGHGRGDGYDVDVYRSCSTSRYLVRVYDVQRGRSSWYVAATREGAEAVGRHGYSPGGAPGAYRYVSAPARIAEVRALRGAEVAS